MLIDREQELEELNFLLKEPTAHLLAVSGRRRLGKTTLLVEWARRSQQPFLYWVASRAPAALLLRQISQAIWQQAYPETAVSADFTFADWSEAFVQLARLATAQRLIVILDEFPYAVESEPALPSLLQNAWDHQLKQTKIMMVLCGSHVGMMDDLMLYNAPLFGRLIGPLRVGPLPFYALSQFFPTYTAAERVAVWALVGGVPAYLERFDSTQSLTANVRRHIFRTTGLFRTDPEHLLHEGVRELQNYVAILLAIAGGAHRLSEIAVQAGLDSSKRIDPYLARLSQLGVVEREVPVTVPRTEQAASRFGRYKLADQYLRFYFRFIWPNQGLLEQGLHDRLWEMVSEQLRAYVGQAAFEELSRAWVLAQARAGQLAFLPEQVGSHWSANVQVDVAAINWRERRLLLGECKWGADPVGRSVIRELIDEKTPKVREALPKGSEWTIDYVFFARNGFTEAAQTEAQSVNARLVDLLALDRGLQHH